MEKSDFPIVSVFIGGKCIFRHNPHYAPYENGTVFELLRAKRYLQVNLGQIDYFMDLVYDSWVEDEPKVIDEEMAKQSFEENKHDAVFGLVHIQDGNKLLWQYSNNTTYCDFKPETLLRAKYWLEKAMEKLNARLEAIAMMKQ